METWQAEWNAGDYLCCDESMIFWRGGGEMHVTYQPRKPTQYGMELKTLVCCISGLLLMAEIAEGKVAQALKEYRDRVGESTAVTLRLCKPW